MRIKMETRNLMADMKHELNIALVSAAKQIIAGAKTSAPQKSGRMVESITIVEHGNNYITIKVPTGYAKLVHWNPHFKFRRGKKSQWLYKAMHGPKGRKILRQCVMSQLGG